MKLTEYVTDKFGLKALALFMAVVLWFSVTMGQEGKVGLTVPMKITNLSPRLKIAGVPPSAVELEISGPRYLLMGLRKERLEVTLDMNGAHEGSLSFTNLDRNIRLRKELHIVRIQPSIIDLTIVINEY